MPERTISALVELLRHKYKGIEDWKDPRFTEPAQPGTAAERELPPPPQNGRSGGFIFDQTFEDTFERSSTPWINGSLIKIPAIRISSNVSRVPTPTTKRI
jgi:hypothetical protein